MKFRIQWLKGKGTLKFTGLICDAVRGYASGQSALEFCQKYSPPPSRRWNINAYGSEWHCVMLAKAWCSKLQHFFEVYSGQANPSYHFTAQDIDCWEEPPELEKLGEQWAQDAKKLQAVLEIRALRPR